MLSIQKRPRQFFCAVMQVLPVEIWIIVIGIVPRTVSFGRPVRAISASVWIAASTINWGTLRRVLKGNRMAHWFFHLSPSGTPAFWLLHGSGHVRYDEWRNVVPTNDWKGEIRSRKLLIVTWSLLHKQQQNFLFWTELQITQGLAKHKCLIVRW